MGVKSNLVLDANPDAFFYELIHSSIQDRKIPTKPETEFYLVKLLARFLTSAQLFSQDDKGNFKEEPLAIMFKDALEINPEEAQRQMFRQVGDVSLYKAGFFRESLDRANIQIDYYIGMGGSAYQQAASRTPDKTHRNVLHELSDRFGSFVGVLCDVSERTTTSKTDQDLLRMYDLWNRTGSSRAASVLKQHGINQKKKPSN